MALFDISVLFFFFIITVKAVHDSMMFWEEGERAVAARRQVIKAPAHRPAPSRPAPSVIRPANARRAVATPIRRTAAVPAKRTAA